MSRPPFPASRLRLKRAYEPASEDDGVRILVDRLWPRGLSKAKAALDDWMKDVAPSTEVREWFGHEPARWTGFQRRYGNELAQHVAELDRIRALARKRTVTLVYGARDQAHNEAVVLKQVLLGQPETASDGYYGVAGTRRPDVEVAIVNSPRRMAQKRNMYQYPTDIYTEPEPDPDTLANLGPLTGMAGIWTSAEGMDVNPKADGPERQAYIERYELQPIDAQTNGPQLFYGLRYHTQIFKPNDPETFHDQVGYWLWEPATGAILLTLSIPRGQAAMVVGHAAPDATTFTLEAVRGSLTNGIVSNPFLEQAFRTDRCTVVIDKHADGTWSYHQETLLVIPGQAEPFRHTDRNRLRKIGEPTPNPTALARKAKAG